MKVKIPCSDLLQNIDDVMKLSKDFFVNVNQSDDALIVDAEEEAMLDFLTAYHNIDMTAAKETMSKYEVKQHAMSDITPEFALQKINEFVVANGGFDNYDVMYEVLNNALHGLI